MGMLPHPVMNPTDSPINDEAGIALDEARNLAKKSDYAGALERHEWFHHNALRIRPAYQGVRLSFALGSWRTLAAKYPPALASLRTLRDNQVRRLMSGTAPPESFQEVAALNRHLDEEDSTLSLFRELDQTHLDLARQCFGYISEQILAADPSLFLRHSPDLEAYAHRQRDQFLTIRESLSQQLPRTQPLVAKADAEFIQLCRALEALATSMGQTDLAKRIAGLSNLTLLEN